MMPPPMPQPSAMPASPSYAALAGAPPEGGMSNGLSNTVGGSQIGTGLIKMGMEVDQALKMMAQMSPAMAEWVLRITQELQQQIGVALQGQLSNVSESGPFPDGSSRMSGLAG